MTSAAARARANRRPLRPFRPCRWEEEPEPRHGSATCSGVERHGAAADLLVGVPGVGKKTAERMLVELKDKVVALSSPEMEEQLKAGAIISVGDAMREDLISALVNLGYQKAAAEKAVIGVLKEAPDANFETALKLSLRKLAK